jgi:SAM-dependent methyltransferase
MSLFDHLTWRGDHFDLGGRTFRLQHQAAQQTADDAFMFYKDRGQLEQFDRFLTETGFAPKRVLELGIWDGGSVVFWTEVLGLERYAAIDLQLRGDSAYFAAWQRERGGGRVSTHWGVSQTDGEQLARIIAEHEMDPLDWVIDDCSHQYAPTRESFELLFPLLRPGGWYVIEDWAWDLQDSFQDKRHPWGVHPPLHPLVLDIARVNPSRPDLVKSLRVYPDFVAIERGPGDGQDFSLSGSIARRPRPWGKIAYLKARHTAGRARRLARRAGP